MNNMIINKHFLVVTSMLILLLPSCQEKAGTNGNITQRGEPIINCEKPIFDESLQTFTLKVSTDSTAGADVIYALLDGDSVIMKSENGVFSGILPLEEGYNVMAEVHWDDTTVVRTVHIVDFVVQPKTVERMTSEQLQKLINNCDLSIKRSTNEHLTQGVKLTVRDSKSVPPQMLPDVITFIENGVWKSVEIINTEYDDNNLINAITLKPIGEQVDIDEEDEDLDY